MTKYLVILISLFQTTVIWAQPSKILLMSPGAHKESYIDFLDTHPEYQSFAEFFLLKRTKNRWSLDQTIVNKLSFFLSQDFDFNEVMNYLKSPTLTRDLSSEEIKLIFDFLEKFFIKKRNKFFKDHPVLKFYFILGQIVEKKDPNFSVRHFHWLSQTTHESSLSINFSSSDYQKLIVNGLELDFKEFKTINFQSTPFHWTLLSNQFQPLVFYGTAQEVLVASQKPKPWISGACQNYEIEAQDLDLYSRGFVYFNEKCIESIKEKIEPSKSWVELNRSELLFTGLTLGIISYLLRDKKIIFHLPF